MKVLQEYKQAIQRFIETDELIFTDDKSDAVIIANEIRKHGVKVKVYETNGFCMILPMSKKWWRDQWDKDSKLN